MRHNDKEDTLKRFMKWLHLVFIIHMTFSLRKFLRVWKINDNAQPNNYKHTHIEIGYYLKQTVLKLYYLFHCSVSFCLGKIDYLWIQVYKVDYRSNNNGHTSLHVTNFMQSRSNSQTARRKDTEETEDLVVDMIFCEVIRSRISTASLITHTPKLQTKHVSKNHPIT